MFNLIQPMFKPFGAVGGVYGKNDHFRAKNGVKIRGPKVECTQQKLALDMTWEWSFLLSLGKKWPKK